MKLTFLGTGTSHGIPVVGCQCRVCKMRDTRNERTRASVFFEVNGKTILIDTATEFRLQAIREGIRRIDACLLTHDHADHLHGIDDLRPLCKPPIAVHAAPDVLAEVRRRFDYIFMDHAEGGGTPVLELVPIKQAFQAAGIGVTPIPLMHGSKRVLGFRIGKVAYCTDCSAIPETSRPLLENLDTLVIDGLRMERHSTHFSIPETLREIAGLRPRQAYLTHLCHAVEHDELSHSLPANVFVAYDGLCLELADPQVCVA